MTRSIPRRVTATILSLFLAGVLPPPISACEWTASGGGLDRHVLQAHGLEDGSAGALAHRLSWLARTLEPVLPLLVAGLDSLSDRSPLSPGPDAGSARLAAGVVSGAAAASSIGIWLARIADGVAHAVPRTPAWSHGAEPACPLAVARS